MLRGIEVKKVIIVGAGGHAKVIVDMLQKNGEFEVVGFIDRAGAEGFWNIPVVGRDRWPGVQGNGDKICIRCAGIG